MNKLQYVELGPKESWPKSAYSAEAGKDEIGEHGDWYSYLQIDRKNEALKEMKELRDQCLRKGTNIERIIVEYSGYGDSGDEFYVFTDNKNKYEYGGYPGSFCDDDCPDISKILDKSKEDQIIDVMLLMVPPGWENNEGGQGHIVWDVKNNKIEVNHEYNVRATEEENSEAEISFEGI